MNLRSATEADEALLTELWQEFEAECPEPPGFAPESWEGAWGRIRAALADGAVALALDEEGGAGLAWMLAPERGRSRLELVYVRPRARRQGLAKALLAECLTAIAAKGATSVSLEVVEANTAARSVWRRLGFEEVARVMTVALEPLGARLGEAPTGASRAAIHVKSVDRTSIDRAVAQFLPRLSAPAVGAEANGWIRIADPLLDGDRDAQERLAKEISDRIGAVCLALALEQGAVVRYRLYEHGRMVDEYLSVPSYYGELPKVEELALIANPTLVSRLTGAPFAEVHRVARTAASTAELPPAEELYAQIAQLMGVEP